jgi:hypothetical protein
MILLVLLADKCDGSITFMYQLNKVNRKSYIAVPSFSGQSCPRIVHSVDPAQSGDRIGTNFKHHKYHGVSAAVVINGGPLVAFRLSVNLWSQWEGC